MILLIDIFYIIILILFRIFESIDCKILKGTIMKIRSYENRDKTGITNLIGDFRVRLAQLNIPVICLYVKFHDLMYKTKDNKKKLLF